MTEQARGVRDRSVVFDLPLGAVTRRFLVAVAAAAVAACGGSLPDAVTAEQPTPSLDRYRPDAGLPVLIDQRSSDWEVFAWISDTSLCIMTARPMKLRRKGQANEVIFCDPAPLGLLAKGRATLPGKPLPQVAPADPRQAEILLVGTTRGAIATVEVTMFGVTATGRVRRLPTRDDRGIGAYTVWLPRSGPDRQGMSLADITSVIGRDRTGRAVATIGPS